MYGISTATVHYGEVLALEGVTVDVLPGQVVCVVGGDGAGKTTLLRAMVGQVPLTEGSVTAPDLASIGYLPASEGSWLDLTVEENLDFVGAVYGLSGERLNDRTTELADSANLLFALERLSRQLSGGMRRKLGFSMAMTHRPPMLVLDEPSTGVDPVSRVELWRLIASAAAAGAAVLTSTTYLDEAERAAHLVVLDEGRAVLSGEPTEVIDSFPYAITAAAEAVHPDRAWRRGRAFHEVWVDEPPAGATVIAPDLEDVVIATGRLGGAGA